MQKKTCGHNGLRQDHIVSLLKVGLSISMHISSIMKSLCNGNKLICQ